VCDFRTIYASFYGAEVRRLFTMNYRQAQRDETATN
jgi:hypothetical protein